MLPPGMLERLELVADAVAAEGVSAEGTQPAEEAEPAGEALARRIEPSSTSWPAVPAG